MSEAPRDKYFMVFIIFLIHGVGTLLPWNMFITAKEYFTDYKLSAKYIGYEFPHNPNFMQYLTFTSLVPVTALGWINVFAPFGGSLTKRIVWTIGIQIVLFVVTIFIAMVDTSGMPSGFFGITLTIVILMNAAVGIYQNSVFGLTAILPEKYTGAVILGNNISGTFASFVSFFSMLSVENIKMAAIYYFITAIIVLLICFDTYFALPLSEFYRFKINEANERKEQEQKQQSADAIVKPPYFYVFKKAFPQLLNIWMVYFVTLALFPSLQSDIKANSEDFSINKKYFTVVTCFLTFNGMAMIGSLLPMFFIWPPAKYLWIPCALRFLYLPFFLFCNYQVRGHERTLPVLITNDWIYWIVSSTMGLTSGYWSSLGMMYAPGTVEEIHSGTAGMLAGGVLGTSILCGVLFSFIWPCLIKM